MKWLLDGVPARERPNQASPESTVYLYADFLVCPTEPLKKGAVQEANIKSASHRRYVKAK
jgi:hypothetical protein